ncbi:HemY protein [Dongia mobilis]|uniref:HemY protein n=1 Tax=Dongia mobilis TaxID=578943 RepID=A0A4R6WWC3_9PROT|nr:heme biosynthesis HemY N-terminal domain-containing protein [Dongia mobilis]TDQ83977.1 HemY protein [Dongia mobilis]
MTFARALWFIIKLAVLVGAAVWLANRPGNLSLVWFGYRIDVPPLGLAMLGVVLGIILLWLVGRVVHRILSVPGEIGAIRGHARETKGYQMLTRGFAAAAAGDAREARRLAQAAQKLLTKGSEAPPITRLLAAQAAQLEGDERGATAHFKVLAETPETAILGLRGLAMNALKSGDEEGARQLAERALAANPNAQWAADTALRLQVKAGRYDAAENSLKALVRAGALGTKEGQRRRAALLTEKARQALIADGHDISADGAVAAAREAVKLAGDFAPARFMLARLLTRQGKRKEAMRLVEQVWDSHPHEILGEAYLLAGENERSLERTQRLERLLRQNPDHPETHRLLAEADLAADLWGEARRHLDRLAALERTAFGAPTQATCRGFARLEERERADMTAARAWLDAAAAAPADAAWICRQCGQPGDAGPECGQWQFTCRACQAVDSLEWRVPARARSVHAALPAAAASGAGPSARANMVEILSPEPPFAAAAQGSRDLPESGQNRPAGPLTDASKAGPRPPEAPQAASVDAARLIN